MKLATLRRRQHGVARRQRRRPAGPAHEPPGRPAEPRRHRDHRPRRPRPGHRRGAGRRQGRGRDQRAAEHLRPLPEPRPGAARRARHRRCSTTSAPRSSPRSRRAAKIRVDGDTRLSSARTPVASGSAAGRRDRRGLDARGEGRAGRAARGVRRQHLGVHEPRARRCCSTASASPRCKHAVRRAARRWSSSAATTTSDDLKALKHYIREYQPVLIGVDGGADALLEAGLQAAHDRRRHGRGVRRRARHAAPRSSCTPTRTAARPAWPACRTSASTAVTFPTSGTSEDVAMLLADESGAALIVAVGTHATLDRVPRQGPGRHGLDVPHPAAARRQARRREGRHPALPQPDLRRPRCCCWCSPR